MRTVQISLARAHTDVLLALLDYDEIEVQDSVYEELYGRGMTDQSISAATGGVGRL